MKTRLKKVVLTVGVVFFVLLSLAGISRAQTQRDAFFLLVDTSKSMNEVVKGWTKSKMETVKASLADFCQNIPLESEVSLFTFDKGVQTVLSTVAITDEAKRQEVIQAVRSISATGSDTYAWSALDRVMAAASDLVGKKPCQVHLFVYTDGKDNERNGPGLAEVLGRYRGKIEARAIYGSYITVGFELEPPVARTLEAGGFEVLSAFDPSLLAPLRANFGWSPGKPPSDAPIQFFDRSLGMISKYEWDFGDGGRSTDKTPSHQYARPAEYEVSLTIHGPRNRKSTSRQTVAVSLPQAPIPDFAVGVEHPHAGMDIVFTDLSQGPVTKTVWDFGDGSPQIVLDYAQPNTARTVSHRFAQKGDYRVKLVATGPGGQQDLTRPLAVGESQAPLPAFDYQLLGERAEAKTAAEKPKLKVRFEDKSKGNVRKRIWNFGDGTAPTEQTTLPSIEHDFGPGTFKVKLTVRGDGEEYSLEKPLEILPPLTFMERYRWFVTTASLILLLAIVIIGWKWRKSQIEKARGRFKGTLSWNRDGKKWYDEVISSPCELYEMQLDESLHGFSGTAVLTKDKSDDLGETYRIVVTRDGYSEESDELDSLGGPSRKKLHGLKFKFTKAF